MQAEHPVFSPSSLQLDPRCYRCATRGATRGVTVFPCRKQAEQVARFRVTKARTEDERTKRAATDGWDRTDGTDWDGGMGPRTPSHSSFGVREGRGGRKQNMSEFE